MTIHTPILKTPDNPPLAIRRATAADDAAIQRLVRSERLNPTKLHFANFHVAEAGGNLVGAVQMRPHGDGGRELGSLVVVPEWRGMGVAAALIDALLEGREGSVHMITDKTFAAHYRRWGFTVVTLSSAPRSIRFNYIAGRMARVISWLKGLPPKQLVVLRRAANSVLS